MKIKTKTGMVLVTRAAYSKKRGFLPQPLRKILS